MSDNPFSQVRVPSANSNPFSAVQLPEEQPYTFETAARDQNLLRAVRSYAKWRDDTDLKSDEEAFEWFKENRRYVDVNTASAVRQAVNARQADDTQKRNIATMMQAWEKLPAFWQEGGQGLEGLWENLKAALVDPVNVVGFGAGAVAAKTAAKAGLSGLGRFAATTGATAAVDAPAAGLANAATQSAQVDVGLRDEIDAGEVGLATGIGALSSVAGGALGEAGAAIANRVDRSTGQLLTSPGSPLMRDVSEVNQKTYQLYDPLSDSIVPNANFTSWGQARRAAKGRQIVIEDGNLKFSGNDVTNSLIRRKLSALENHVFDDKSSLDRLVNLKERFAIPRYTVADGQVSVQHRTHGMLDALETALTTENASLVAEMATMGHRPRTMTVGGKQVSVGLDMAAQFRWNDDTGIELIQNSTSMADILTRLREEQGVEAVGLLEEFMTLSRAERNMLGIGRQEAKNVTNRMSAADINQALQDPKYAPLRPYVQELQQFNENFLNFMVDSQVLSRREANELLRANPVYLPFVRIERALGMEEGQLSALTSTLQKELKGVQAGAQDEGLTRTMALRQYRNSVEAAMLKGFENIRLRALVRDVETLPDNMQKLILREVESDGDISVSFNGTKKQYKVGDEALLATVKRFGPNLLRDQPTSPLWQLAQAHTQALTYAITRWPEFVLANSAVIDPVSGAIMSDSPKTAPFLNMIRGAVQMSRNSDLVKVAMASSALQGGVVSQENARLIRKFFESRGMDTTNIWGIDATQDATILHRVQSAIMGWTVDNLLSRPMRAADNFAEIVEGSTRLNEFVQQLNANAGNTGRAAARSIRSNINFRTKGASEDINAALSVMPFSRAIINGVYQPSKKMFRGGLKQQQARLAGLSAALIGLYAYNMTYHREGLESKTPEERAMFMWFFPGTDYEFKLRKDQTLALPANMAEYMVDQLSVEQQDVVTALAETFKFAGGQIGGNYVNTEGATLSTFLPPLFGGPVGVWSGEKFGGPIVPEYLKGMPSEEQYIPGRTPQMFRSMSEATGGFMSPLEYEYLFRTWAGPLATAAGDIDRFSNPETALRANQYDLPIVRRFVSDPDEPKRMTRWTEDLYKLAERANVDVEALQSANYLQRVSALEDLATKLQEQGSMDPFYFGANPGISDFVSRLAAIRKEVRRMEETPLSPQEKERVSRQVQAGINEATEQFVRGMYTARRQFRDSMEQTERLLEDKK